MSLYFFYNLFLYEMIAWIVKKFPLEILGGQVVGSANTMGEGS